MTEPDVETVDAYIAGFPPATAEVLRQLRSIVREEAPRAVESISYHMPTYTQGARPLVFFAGWKTHVALYAVPRFEGGLESELERYRAAKDTVKFSLAQPLPAELVARVVREIVVLRADD
jgi:uncharacterized protein YdhG (YjbR/CyaY superfamily)